MTNTNVPVSPKSPTLLASATDWKVIIAKYCRLTNEEAMDLGISTTLLLKVDTSKGNWWILRYNSFLNVNLLVGSSMNNGDVSEYHETNELAEEMMNEVNGVHFLHFIPLFVAYVYVNSGSLLE